MKNLLICPSARPGVRLLSRNAPLAAVPMLGQSLLEYWLSHLALQGAANVMVITQDRPEQVQALLADGARWGLSVEVIAESRELTPAEALLKYGPQLDAAPATSAITVLDHFPGFPERQIFGSYADWFEGLLQWLPHALTPDRVGLHQLRPGIWADRLTHISTTAQLRPPCWIGRGAFVGAGAVLGPHTIIEDGAFIEPNTEIVGSCIAANTFVGQAARISNSIALGSILVDRSTNSAITVPDSFLLCALRQPRVPRTQNWLHRVAELYSRNKEEAHMLWKQFLLHKQG
jgi:NDP-sugar pyrophosphorylase family protein